MAGTHPNEEDVAATTGLKSAWRWIWIQLTSISFWVVSALILVAAVGTVLSYAGIRNWGLSAGYPYWLACLLPISIDGMVFAGVLQVMHATATSTSKTYGWWLTSTGAVVSVAANAIESTTTIQQAIHPDVMTAIAHALPPITVVLTLEAMLNISSQRRKQVEAEAKAKAISRQEPLKRGRVEVPTGGAPALVSMSPRLATVEPGIVQVPVTPDQPPAPAPEPAPVGGVGPAVRTTTTATVTALAGRKSAVAAAEKERIVHRRVVEGVTVDQVAAEFGVSAASVKRFVKEARDASDLMAG